MVVCILLSVAFDGAWLIRRLNLLLKIAEIAPQRCACSLACLNCFVADPASESLEGFHHRHTCRA